MMTSKRVLAALALAALPAASAFAQSAQQDVNLTANVAQFCKFNTVNLPGGSLVNMSVVSSSTSSSVLQVANPINTTTGTLNAASFQMTLASACNSQSRVVLTTQNGGMTPGVAPVVDPGSSAAFATKINYTATAFWNGLSVAAIATDGSTPAGFTSTGNTIAGPRTGPVTVFFNIDSSPTTIVAAGTYADTLTVRLEPQ